MPGPGANPNWPDLRIYADFTNPGADPNYTWTDITKWCRRLGSGALMHCERGRNYERAQTDAGVLNFVLDNSTGVFDPTNTGSPYYPNVKPIRKVKVEATWLGVTYKLWWGRVEDWPRLWKASGFWGEITATARGPLSSLSTVTLNSPWLNAAVVDGAKAIYRLNDPSGAVDAANSSSVQQLYAPIMYSPATTVDSKFTFGGTPGSANLAGDPTGSLALSPENVFLGAAGYYLQTADASDDSADLIMPSSGGWSWEGWFAYGARQAGNAGPVIISQIDANPASVDQNVQFSIGFVGSNTTPGAYIIGSSSFAQCDSLVPVLDGLWHHVVLTFASNARTLKFYVDNVVTTNVAASAIGSYIAPSVLQQAGMRVSTLLPDGIGAFNGSLKNLAWYDSVLTPAQVADHFAAGGGYTGEDTGARIERLLEYAPYDLILSGASVGAGPKQVGNSILGPAVIEGQNVVQAVQNANDTEIGTVWERGDGYVVFNNRQSRGPSTSVATFGEAGFPYQEDLNILQDPAEIFTDVIVARNGGITVHQLDTGAELDYFPRTMNISSQDYTDTQAILLSQYQLGRYKVARTRIPTLTLRPSANITLWPQALGREIGDRITVTRNNPGAPSISEDFYIDKITHDAQTGQWTTTWMLTTAALWDEFYFQLNSATYGVLDTNRLGF